MFADIGDYNSRVQAGKRIESKILDALRAKGFKIDNPTSTEDMHDKIDGWWVTKENKRFPLQIKFRQSGDDILVELIKDLELGKIGRDMVTKAVLYLVADRNGTTRMFYTKEIKDQAQKILDQVEDDLQTEPQKTSWEGPHWQAKAQIDRASGNRKVVAYLNPRAFKALATWNLNLYEAILKEDYKKLIDLSD